MNRVHDLSGDWFVMPPDVDFTLWGFAVEDLVDTVLVSTRTQQRQRPLGGWDGNTRGGDVMCPYCTGEECNQLHSFDDHCDCDVSDRHAGRECSDPEYRDEVVWADPPFVRVVEVLSIMEFQTISTTRRGRWIAGLRGDLVAVQSCDGAHLRTQPAFALPGARPGGWAVRVEPAECPELDCLGGHQVEPDPSTGEPLSVGPCRMCGGDGYYPPDTTWLGASQPINRRQATDG